MFAVDDREGLATTTFFRATAAIERGLADLRAGRQLSEDESVDMKQFEEIVDIARWTEIETRFRDSRE